MANLVQNFKKCECLLLELERQEVALFTETPRKACILCIQNALLKLCQRLIKQERNLIQIEMTKNHDPVLNKRHDPNASLKFMKCVGWSISEPSIL